MLLFAFAERGFSAAVPRRNLKISVSGQVKAPAAANFRSSCNLKSGSLPSFPAAGMGGDLKNLTHIPLIILLLFALGCSRAPVSVRVDGGTAEQVFVPRLSIQETGELYCQWVEFHRDSIGGAGCAWDLPTRKFGTPEGFDFFNRRYVQCIPELERFTFSNHHTATFVAHSCIQECYMLARDEDGERESAWATAPAVLSYPVQVDSLFLLLYESSTQKGLITVWMDRQGRERSRDTLAIGSPDFAAAGGGGAVLVKAEENYFSVYQLDYACSWIDSTEVTRLYPIQQQIGTDYFESGGDLFIVSGYRKPESREIEFETHVLRGIKRESQHIAAVKRESLGDVVAFRAAASGKDFPYLLGLLQEPERMQFVALGLDDEGYWSRVSERAEVSPTIQEFAVARYGETLIAAYTAASEETLAAANACYVVQFNLE